MPAESPRSDAHRMSQLDGMRALAALTVIVQHAGPEAMRRLIFVGGAAVWFFFVLSGYLITGILVRAKDAAARSGGSRRGVLAAFYARRSVRIFPLYYFVVLLALAVGVPDVRRLWAWDLTYTLNIRMAIWHDGFPAMDHLWSLGVEEQFYLCWPLVVLATPRRFLTAAAAGMVAVGVLSRIGFGLMVPDPTTSYVATTSNLDCLGMGALLALRRIDGKGMPVLLGLVAGIVVMAAAFALDRLAPALRANLYLKPVAFAAIAAWVVDRGARGIRGPIGAFLASPPMVYLGAISYGLYVYHAAIPPILKACGIEIPVNALYFPIMLGLTVAIASVSWFAFEKPLNDLKRFFPYSKSVPSGEAAIENLARAAAPAANP